MIRLQLVISQLANGYLIETNYKPYGGQNDMRAALEFLDKHQSAQDHWIARDIHEAMDITKALFAGETPPAPIPAVFREEAEHGG